MTHPNQPQTPALVTVGLIEQRVRFTTIGKPTKANADLADTVHSRLGTIIKTMDLPRIHIMAEGSRILLHGDVSTEQDASLIEGIVKSFDDVDSVESHLHIGLLPSDTRPSKGHSVETSLSNQSDMMKEFFKSAAAIGLTGGPAQSAIKGTLTAILEQVPPDERQHVIAHFPTDVAHFVKPRHHFGDENIHWKTELELDAAASLRGGFDLPTAEVLVPLIIGVIRRFVPEEDHDIVATLHTALKELWQISETPQ